MTTPTRETLRWKQRPFPELVRLAWPIGVSMLSYSFMTLVDTLFVGRLGASSLAGVSVGGVAAFTLLCFGFGLLRAVKVAVSQAVGAGQGGRSGGLLAAGLMWAAAIGLANVALGLQLAPWLGRVTAGTEAAGHASAYLAVRVLGAPLVLTAIALREARYGHGDGQTPMRATVAANLANVVLDWLLVVELDLGVVGAAWASVAAAAIDAGWLVVSQRRHGFGSLEAGRRQLRTLWRLGVPLGLQMLLEVGAFAVITVIFAAMGPVEVAAHQIALQVAHLSFLPAFALGEAASVLAGQAVGARQEALVTQVAARTLLAAAIYTGLCAGAFAVFAEPIARAFGDEPLLVRRTTQLLWVAAAFQIFDAANIVARCVLRGTGDVRFAAVVSVTVSWVCTPPLALLLGYGLGLGVLGGWLGICLEIVVSAAILWRRLLRGGWRVAADRCRGELMRDAPPPSSRPRLEPLPAP